MLFVNIKQNPWNLELTVFLLRIFEHSLEKICLLTIKNTHPKLSRLWVFLGIAELTIRSIQIFFSHFEEAGFCVSFRIGK